MLKRRVDLRKEPAELRSFVAEMLDEDRFCESEIMDSIERLKSQRKIVEPTPGYLDIPKGR